MPDNIEPETENNSGLPPLRELYFYLTEGCNMACRHCWLSPKHDKDGTHTPHLPIELFERAIAEAGELGLKTVKLTGGEPLMHPDFVELLGIVRSRELNVIVETNGLLCTPEVAGEIAKVPNRAISVSIDGADAATHEWVRGVEGSFEKAKNAVRNLAAVNTPPQIIMTLMRKNCGQVEAVIRMAEELGASSVKFNVVQPTARGESLYENSLALSVPEIIELGRQVEKELGVALLQPPKI